MVKRITLGPRDVEVDRKHIDPMINIFPNENDPEDVVINLLKGIGLIDAMIAKIETIDERLKTNVYNRQQLASLIHEREYLRIFLAASEKYANDVFAKIPHK